MRQGDVEQRAAFRKRKRGLTLLMGIQFFGFLPFVALVALLDRKAWSSTALVTPAVFAWLSWWASTVFRLRRAHCPRCGSNFYGGVFPHPSIAIRPRVILGLRCAYCGLRRYQGF